MKTAIQLSVGEGVDPFSVAGASSRAKVRALARLLKAVVGGGLLSRSTTRPTLKHGTGHASALLALATCAAGTVVEINGVPFTAITGTAVPAFDEFDIDGTDIVDATDLCRAINACTDARVSGVVEACNFTAIATLTTAVAGNKITIAGVTFTGKAGAVDEGSEYFSVDTGNNAAAASLGAQINAHPYLSTLVRADVASAVVTIRQRRGTTGLRVTDDNTPIALTGVTADLMIATDDILLTAVGKGVAGNGVTVKTLGIAASTTATCATVVPTDTLVINGQSLTAIQQRATGTLTAAAAAAADTFVLDGVTFTGVEGAAVLGQPEFSVDTGNNETAASIAAQINAYYEFSGLYTATSAAAVATIRAVDAGTAANEVTLVGTAVRLAASDATLLGGIAVANDQFDASPGSTDAQVATDLARCINESTTALVNQYARATATAAVVTVRAKQPAGYGNAITMASTGGTITVAASQLAGSTELSTGGAQASCTLTCASVLNGETCAVNGVTLTAHTDTQANNQFSIAGGDNATAAALALAINNSTTAGLAPVVATVSNNVVTVKSRRGGILGNAITVATGQGTIVISGAQTRLTGGAAPTTVVPSAERLSGGSESTLTF